MNVSTHRLTHNNSLISQIYKKSVKTQDLTTPNCTPNVRWADLGLSRGRIGYPTEPACYIFLPVSAHKGHTLPVFFKT